LLPTAQASPGAMVVIALASWKPAEVGNGATVHAVPLKC